MPLYLLKKGTGNHSHVDKRGVRTLVKPGETFEAEPYEVENFMDKLEQLTPNDPLPPPPAEEDKLKVVEREDKKGFDVYNPVSKKTINTAPLTKVQAEEIANVGRAEQDMENTEDVGGAKGVHTRRRTKPSKGEPEPDKE